MITFNIQTDDVGVRLYPIAFAVTSSCLVIYDMCRFNVLYILLARKDNAGEWFCCFILIHIRFNFHDAH